MDSVVIMSIAEVILNSIPILVDKLERLLLNFDKREIWLTNKLNIVRDCHYAIDIEDIQRSATCLTHIVADSELLLVWLLRASRVKVELL